MSIRQQQPVMDRLTEAVLSDPSIHFVKQPALFGRKKRRWFVLHRRSHMLAYYAMPFIPPQKGDIKGVINLAEVVDVNAFGPRLEIQVSRGRSTYKLLADSDKVASDWATLIRREAHTSGLANPLNSAVQKKCNTAEVQEDPLYTEYGGFKFANDKPELYTDYKPNRNAVTNDDDEDDGNYGNFTPNAAVTKGTDGRAEPIDAGYLDQQAAVAQDTGYLDQKPAGQESVAQDVGYLDQQPATEAAKGTAESAEPTDGGDANNEAPTSTDSEPALYDQAGPSKVEGEEEEEEEAPASTPDEPALYDQAGPSKVEGEEEEEEAPASTPDEPALYDQAGPSKVEGEEEEVPASTPDEPALYDQAGPSKVEGEEAPAEATSIEAQSIEGETNGDDAATTLAE